MPCLGANATDRPTTIDLSTLDLPPTMPVLRGVLACLFCLFIAASAAAQEDAYHQWLRAHLEDDHNLSGGTWSLGDTENEVLALAQPTSGVDQDAISVSGQPFTRGHRYTILQPTAETWHRTVRFHITESVNDGDALLLAIWLRHTWPSDVVGQAETVFEQAADPYTKSLTGSYSVPMEWSLYLIPFESVGDYGPNQARFQLQLGFQRQMIELGGLSLLNFGADVSTAELPRVIPTQVAYGGHGPDAAWRAAAQERIEEHRMGTLRVRVQDADGAPVPDAVLNVEMTRHAFGFGTAVNSGILVGSGRIQDYIERLRDLTGDGRTFNIAVLENALKWPQWETNWPLSKEAKVTAVTWLVSRGMDVRGHNLVWPGWEWLPDDIEANQDNPDYISDRIQNHIAEIAGYDGLQGRIRDWDVVNEPTHETDLRDVFAGTAEHPTGEEIYAEWFEWAKEADPEARLFVNDYSIISSYGPAPAARSHYKAIIRDLIETGAPLDGIGVQGHMGNPLTPIDTLYKVIDELAAFGKAISVTEYDAAGLDEEIAGDYMRDFLTIIFSHPAVESFLMWGFWDGSHWLDDAPMFREDWSLKPSGEAFLGLVFDEWWTDVSAASDEEGMWMGRGFAGTYNVSATVDGEIAEQEVVVSASDTTDALLTMTATSREDDEALRRFSVAPNYPDPAFDRTTIDYVLDAPRRVDVEVFDVLGRSVRLIERGIEGVGKHSITLDVQSLSAGTYFYRITAGDHHGTGTLSVIR